MKTNRLNRRDFLKAAAAASAGGVLAACTPETTTVTVRETVEVPGETVIQTIQVPGEAVVVTATPPAPEAVTIRFIATAPPEYYRTDAFMEQNNLITIEFEDIGDEAFDQVVLTSVASGTPPELAWASVQGVWRFAQVGAAMEISQIIAASPHPEVDQIDPAAIAQYNSPGFFQKNLVMMAPGQYGWPVYKTIYIMIYNQKLLEDAGAEIPERGWTWDQWQNTLMKITSTGSAKGFVMPGGTETSLFIHSMLWTNNTGVYDAEGNCSLNSPEAVETLQFLQDITLKDKTVIQASGAEGVDFLTGNVAFQFWGNWVVGWYDAALADPYGIVPVPIKQTEALHNGVDGFMFLTGAPHPEAGWEYAKWLSGTAGQTVLNEADQVEVISVNLKAAEGAYVNPGFGIPEGAEDWFLTMPSSELAHYRPWIPVGPGFNYDTAYDNIWQGDDVQQTLDQIASTIDAMNESQPKFG